MKTLSRSRSAFTLVEAMITAAVMSMVMAAVTAAVISLQRSFAASQDFILAHLEQVRTLDTLKRDGRAARSAEVRAGGSCVVFTIPTQEPGLLNLQLPTSVLGLLLPAGSSTTPTTKEVTYTFAGKRVTRTEGAKVQTVATRQNTFKVEQAGSQLNATIAFLSRYSNQPKESEATTLSSALSYRANTW